jgi:D-alanyl-D-alanine carboxypeptidase
VLQKECDEMRKRRERIVQTRTGGYKADQVRKIKIVMAVIAVMVSFSLVAGAVLTWIQIKRPFEKHSASSSASSSVSVSSESEELAVYDNAYNLVVVNATTPLQADFALQIEKIQGVSVDSRIIPALKKMMQDAQSEGSPLKLTGGYVEAKEQDKLFNEGVQNLIKNQGYSKVRAENQMQITIGRGGYNEKQTGMAVTFSAEGLTGNQNFTATEQYKWLIKNSVRYGFVLRYPQKKTAVTGMEFNPNQFRYVGVENAVKMREYSMCLEEYAAYVRQRS